MFIKESNLQYASLYMTYYIRPRPRRVLDPWFSLDCGSWSLCTSSAEISWKSASRSDVFKRMNVLTRYKAVITTAYSLYSRRVRLCLLMYIGFVTCVLSFTSRQCGLESESSNAI